MIFSTARKFIMNNNNINKSIFAYMTKWNVEAFCGYKPITTFWQDFCIAEAFGTSAIQDTFDRAFEEWKWNYKYLTELVMVLNHKIWYWYEKNDKYGELYNSLWIKANDYALDNLKGAEARYFYEVTD